MVTNFRNGSGSETTLCILKVNTFFRKTTLTWRHGDLSDILGLIGLRIGHQLPISERHHLSDQAILPVGRVHHVRA
jgi:hypothetical protein